MIGELLENEVLKPVSIDPRRHTRVSQIGAAKAMNRRQTKVTKRLGRANVENQAEAKLARVEPGLPRARVHERRTDFHVGRSELQRRAAGIA